MARYVSLPLLVSFVFVGGVNAFVSRSTSSSYWHGPKKVVLFGGSMDNLDLSGNSWKPTEGRMHSTDTSDYEHLLTNQEDIDMMNDLSFTDGIYGSQVGLDANKNKGPQLPGMEHLGEDAIMMGGIEVASGIPADMEFVASSVPDGTIQISCAASTTGHLHVQEVKPVCMGYEDYYASFTKDSDPIFRITDATATGRMDRRGGESTFLEIIVDPQGHGGNFKGQLVVNLPDDGSSYTYDVQVTSM